MYATADGDLMPGVFTPAQHRALAAVLEDAGCPVAGLAAVADWPDLWAEAETLAGEPIRRRLHGARERRRGSRASPRRTCQWSGS